MIYSPMKIKHQSLNTNTFSVLYINLPFKTSHIGEYIHGQLFGGAKDERGKVNYPKNI